MTQPTRQKPLAFFYIFVFIFGLSSTAFATAEWGGVNTLNNTSSATLGGESTTDIIVDIDGNDDSHVVWREETQSFYNIMSNHHIDGTWEGPQALRQCDYTCTDLSASFNASGDGIATWVETNDDSTKSVYGKFYTDGDWGEIFQINSEDSTSMTSLHTHISESGNVIVTWTQIVSTSSSSQTHANVYVSGAWQGSERICSSSRRAFTPHGDISDAGEAVVVWRQHDGSEYRTYANIFSSGSWGGDSTIDNSGYSSTNQPRVAILGSGTYAAIFTQGSSSHIRLYVSSYSSGAWGTPNALDTETTTASHAVITSNGSEFITAWLQRDSSSDTRVYTSGWVGGSGLTTSTIDNSGETSHSAALDLDSSGNGVATWIQRDSTNSRAWVNFMGSSGSWGTPEALDDLEADTNPSSPAIALNDNGNAILAWKESDGNQQRLHVRLYQSGSWLDSTTADGINYEVNTNIIAINANDEAVAAWTQQGDEYRRLYASILSSDGTWSAATAMDANTDDIDNSPQIGISSDGTAFVAWKQSDGVGEQLYVRVYSGGSWSAAETLADSSLGLGVDSFNLTVSESGVAALAWVNDSDTTANNDVNISVYNSGSWSSAVELASNATSNFPPALASNANGSIVAFFPNLASTGDYELVVAKYVSGAWESSTSTVKSNTTTDFEWDVDMNDSGDILAMWQTDDFELKARVYTGGSWSAEAQLNDETTYTSYYSINAALITNDGTAVVSWFNEHNTSSLNSVHAQVFSGGSWASSVTEFTSESGESFLMCSAKDKANNKVLLVFSDYDSTDGNLLKASVYESGSWSETETLLSSTETGFTSDETSCALNSGVGFVGWSSTEGSSTSDYKADYSLFEDGEWQPSATLTNGNVLGALPQTAISTNGTVLATWQEIDSNYHERLHAQLYAEPSAADAGSDDSSGGGSDDAGTGSDASTGTGGSGDGTTATTTTTDGAASGDSADADGADAAAAAGGGCSLGQTSAPHAGPWMLFGLLSLLMLARRTKRV